MSKSYTGLLRCNTFDEALAYLKLSYSVGEDILGHHRYIMQRFYKTEKWLRTRDLIIIRDEGCDLGFDGYDILDMILVHHINVITIDDVLNDDPKLYDPDNLICTTLRSHNYIHYGKKIYNDGLIERSVNDTCPWIRN